MIRIELTPDDARLLREILESYLSDLRVEITATDHKDFREILKREEAFIKMLLPRLQERETNHAV